MTRKWARLSIILLLSALALLHARVALAGCLADPSMASEPASQCCQSADGNAGQAEPDADILAQLCGYHCARAPVPQKPAANFLLPISGTPSGPLYRHPVVYASDASGLELRRFLAGPPVTLQLIYLLQRLLI